MRECLTRREDYYGERAMLKLRKILFRRDSDMKNRLRFKTGEFVHDEYQRADIIARLEMWLIDEEYMAKVDVHDLIRDSLREIRDLRVKNAETQALAAREQSLADALAFTTSGLLSFIPDETIDLISDDLRQKIGAVLDAWQNARRLSE